MTPPSGAAAAAPSVAEARNSGAQVVSAADKLFKDKPLSRQAYERALEYWNKAGNVQTGRDKLNGLAEMRAANTADTVGKYADRRAAQGIERNIAARPKVAKPQSKAELEADVKREEIEAGIYKSIMDNYTDALTKQDPARAVRLTNIALAINGLSKSANKKNTELAGVLNQLTGGQKARFIAAVEQAQYEEELSGGPQDLQPIMMSVLESMGLLKPKK